MIHPSVLSDYLLMSDRTGNSVGMVVLKEKKN